MSIYYLLRNQSVIHNTPSLVQKAPPIELPKPSAVLDVVARGFGTISVTVQLPAAADLGVSFVNVSSVTLSGRHHATDAIPVLV